MGYAALGPVMAGLLLLAAIQLLFNENHNGSEIRCRLVILYNSVR